MWPIKSVDSEENVQRLATETGLHSGIARALYLRGIKTLSAVEKFFFADLNDLYPFTLLPDIDRAVIRIKEALSNKEKILIWGHEDLDGITSTIILVEALKELNGEILFYIPQKGKEPHGLEANRVLNYKKEGVKLIITVDCGITNIEEISILKNQGVDVIVTDHHEILNKLPPAIANVNVKRHDSLYPFSQLAACGIAFKLAEALYYKIFKKPLFEVTPKSADFLIYAALGTIADRVPLIEENRIFVKYGLKFVKNANYRSTLIKVLVEKLALTNTFLPTEKIINEVLPLFSAANGNEACRYFLSNDEKEIFEWLNRLYSESQNWRNLAKENLLLAEQIAEIAEGIIIIRDERLSLKTLGHIAGKLKDQYQLPAIALGKKDNTWIAECRGINGVDLIEMLKSLDSYLLTYGGHKKACGFTVRHDKLFELLTQIKEYARKNFADKIIKETIIAADGILPIRELPLETILKFPPFGEGNPSPVFISKDTAINKDHNYLNFLERPELKINVNWERLNNRLFELYPERVFADILYTINDSGEIVLLNIDYPQ
jgi:single-stranded-DNA-specific exonuclease